MSTVLPSIAPLPMGNIGQAQIPNNVVADWARNRIIVMGYNGTPGPPPYWLMSVNPVTRTVVNQVSLTAVDNRAAVLDSLGYYYWWNANVVHKVDPITLSDVATCTMSFAHQPDNVTDSTCAVLIGGHDYAVTASLLGNTLNVVDLNLMMEQPTNYTIAEGATGAHVYAGKPGTGQLYIVKGNAGVGGSQIAFYKMTVAASGAATIAPLPYINASDVGWTVFSDVQNGFWDPSDGNLCLVAVGTSGSYKFLKVNVLTGAVMWSLSTSGFTLRWNQWRVSRGYVTFLDHTTLVSVNLATGASTSLGMGAPFTSDGGGAQLYDGVNGFSAVFSTWVTAYTPPPVTTGGLDNTTPTQHQWVIFENLAPPSGRSQGHVI